MSKSTRKFKHDDNSNTRLPPHRRPSKSPFKMLSQDERVSPHTYSFALGMLVPMDDTEE